MTILEQIKIICEYYYERFSISDLDIIKRQWNYFELKLY